MRFLSIDCQFDPRCVQTRVEKRGRHMNSPQLEGKSDELKASSSNQGKHRSLLSVPCIMTQIDLSSQSESHGLQGEGRCQCIRSSLELEYVLVSKSFLDNFPQLPGAWA